MIKKSPGYAYLRNLRYETFDENARAHSVCPQLFHPHKNSFLAWTFPES